MHCLQSGNLRVCRDNPCLYQVFGQPCDHAASNRVGDTDRPSQKNYRCDRPSERGQRDFQRIKSAASELSIAPGIDEGT